MPSSDKNPKRIVNHETLEIQGDLRSTEFKGPPKGSDLFATIKDGTADVATLKLLVPGFELLEELGRGAFGVVYRARDEKLDRMVAIKVSLIDDMSRREQYVKEAKNAAKLESPGIVPVFQVGTLAGGQPFVVQRLIDGSTLRKMLADAGNLELRHACWLLSQIASALAQAHSLGMIHRDLKPDNILIDGLGKPWVADFGLAILEEDQQQHSGERAGTPLYMSPEQLRGQTEWLDGRADIYAMGIMLYEMLVGRTPFDARNLKELEEQVFHRDPKPISQRMPSIPVALDVIFQNCCAKQVNDRYSNAFELVTDLETVIAGLPETDASVPVPKKAFANAAARRSTASPVMISARRKTIRQATQLQSTLRDIHIPKHWLATKWIFVPLALALAGLLFFLASGWWKGEEPNLTLGAGEQLSPAKLQLPATATDPQQTGSTEPAIPSAPEFQAGQIKAIDPQEVIPQRPFRVSKGPGGTHATLASAIAMASDGEIITVLPGYYAESLSPVRSVRLVGTGNKEDVVIIGANQPALLIQADVDIELSNLTLEGDKSNATEFNTIELIKGKLVLNNCTVNSRSYDCVKAHPQTEFSAKKCNFRTSAQPAVYAEELAELKLVDCLFDIRPSESDLSVGIQANKCSGLVQGCTFDGAGAAIGIQWGDADQTVSIQDSKFHKCKTAAIFQDCSQIEFLGAVGAQISGCSQGLLLQRCTAVVKNIDFSGSDGEYALRIIDQGQLPAVPRINLSGCHISGFATAISIEHAHVAISDLECKSSTQSGIQLVQQSQLNLSNSRISHSVLAGLHIEDSVATLDGCQFTDHEALGVSVDAGADALHMSDCTFKDNLVGLGVHSGTITLRGGGFSQNDVGIVVMERPGAKSEQAATFLDIQDAYFRNHKVDAFQVHAPCKIRLEGGVFSDPANRDRPKIGPGLKLRQEGELSVIEPNST